MSAQAPGRRYVLITPCRDEAEFARRTLDSVVTQSVRPTLWVIVDDGSSDTTPAILAEYARRFDFIRVMRRDDRGRRSVGPGVIEAFYAGYETIDPLDFDYLCKLDLDLELPPRYFELLMQRMETEPRLGTCSGKPYYWGSDGQLSREECGDEASIGPTKFYRVECFRQIGGFVREVAWDGIDCHRCRMFGWMARSWDDPELRVLHLRRMGSSEKGIVTGRVRQGRGQYFMGTGLAYMTATSLYRATHHPLLIGGLAMWWGYVSSLVRRAPRYEDPGFRRFLRRYQWDCLLRGKAAATRRLDERQTAQWRPEQRPPAAAFNVASTRPQPTHDRL
jgi:glycosyltransferase involved in cell wall biosynthesis